MRFLPPCAISPLLFQILLFSPLSFFLSSWIPAAPLRSKSRVLVNIPRGWASDPGCPIGDSIHRMPILPSGLVAKALDLQPSGAVELENMERLLWASDGTFGYVRYHRCLWTTARVLQKRDIGGDLEEETQTILARVWRLDQIRPPENQASIRSEPSKSRLQFEFSLWIVLGFGSKQFFRGNFICPRNFLPLLSSSRLDDSIAWTNHPEKRRLGWMIENLIQFQQYSMASGTFQNL